MILNLNFKVISFHVKPENSYHLLQLAESWPQKIFMASSFRRQIPFIQKFKNALPISKSLGP